MTRALIECASTNASELLWGCTVQWRVTEVTNSGIGEPNYSLHTLRALDSKSLRFSREVYQNGRFDFRLDYACTARYAWKLAPNWLIIMNPEPPFPKGHDLDSVMHSTIDSLAVMLSGGLCMISNLPLDSTPVVQVTDSTAWRAVWNGSEENSLAAEGLWDHEARQAFVMTLSGSVVNGTWSFSDWHFNTVLAAWIPDLVDYLDLRSMRRLRFEFVQAFRESPEEYLSALALPTFDSADSVIGPLDFHLITDFRIIPAEYRWNGPRGTHTTTDLELLSVNATAESRLRISGRCAAGVVIFGLLAIRIGTNNLAKKGSPYVAIIS